MMMEIRKHVHPIAEDDTTISGVYDYMIHAGSVEIWRNGRIRVIKYFTEYTFDKSELKGLTKNDLRMTAEEFADLVDEVRWYCI